MSDSDGFSQQIMVVDHILHNEASIPATPLYSRLSNNDLLNCLLFDFNHNDNGSPTSYGDNNNNLDFVDEIFPN